MAFYGIANIFQALCEEPPNFTIVYNKGKRTFSTLVHVQQIINSDFLKFYFIRAEFSFLSYLHKHP